METKRLFFWGGNLAPDSPVYIERPEDQKLAEHILAGDYVTVLAPRQMGKTSLLYRVMSRLRAQGTAVAYLDLSATREESLETFYRHLAATIHEQVDPQGEAPTGLATHLDFLNYLRAVAGKLGESTRLVLMLDEVGSVPPQMCDPFFSNVRYVFSNREVRAEFKRIVFVLCGTFQPRDLIQNPANSPFNISKTVRMSDLSRDGVRRLVSMLERMGIPVAEEIPDEIYGWTAGQPYLTQRLCSIFEEWKIPVNGKEVAQSAVRELMQDDNNLDHILHRIQQESELHSWLQRILAGEKIRFNRMTNPRLARLELVGAITAGKDGNCKLRNRLYEELLRDNLGAAEPGEEPPRPTVRAAAPADEGKECTAVCIDVVNSTLLKQHQDKVDVTYTFQQLHQYVANLVRRRGGHVKDVAGDGTMIIFTQPDEAIRCCHELQGHLSAFNQRHNKLSQDLALRIGVNTGKVLASDLEDARMTAGLFDYTLDLAGKVQKASGPGEIAVTSNTLTRLEQPVEVAREEYWPEFDVTIHVLTAEKGSPQER